MTPQAQAQAPLIGSVIERKPGSSANTFNAKSKPSDKTGFPTVSHRSQSAFARARKNEKSIGGGSTRDRPREPPIVSPSVRPPPPTKAQIKDGETEGWRKDVEEENIRRVEGMTEEEREEERREILERFGPNVAEILRRAREARESKHATSVADPPIVSEEPVVHSPSPQRGPRKSALVSRPTSPTPHSAASTRPSSRERHLRFAELKPQDVHVYESAPPSPKRKPILALMPATPDDGPTTPLGEFSGKGWMAGSPRPIPSKSASAGEREEEEGTPEDIRRRFFPSAPAHNPSLDWILSPSSSSPSSSRAVPPNGPEQTLRFDLTGTPIPPSLSLTLPTHLGLHHHAEGSHAGYTLDDLFLLSRSSVRAQRASMLDVLGRIARRLSRNFKPSRPVASDRDISRDEHSDDEGIPELRGLEHSLRKRILATGLEALSEKGSLGVQAVNVVWACVVGWDEDLVDIEGVELADFSRYSTFNIHPSSDNQMGSETEKEKEQEIDKDKEDAISTLPLDYLLPQISTLIGTQAHPRETLLQLLSILHRLAQHSNEYAGKIVKTPKLIANVVSTFLLTPGGFVVDSTEAGMGTMPEPFALQVLVTLASASRENARMLCDPADALLRFVVSFPTKPSPQPQPHSETETSPAHTPTLATSLLIGTLRLYATLASYGLYAHIATVASEHLGRIHAYVMGNFESSVSVTNNFNHSKETHQSQSQPQSQSQSTESHQSQTQSHSRNRLTLLTTYLDLLERWITCARDPHRTEPTHEILWSQVVGWGWGEDLVGLRGRLVSDHDGEAEVEDEEVSEGGKVKTSTNDQLARTGHPPTPDEREVWAATWRANAAWLEGCTVNAPKGGSAEKAKLVECVKDGFEGGVERRVVDGAVQRLGALLEELSLEADVSNSTLREMEREATILSSAIRFWLSTLPSSNQTGLPAPPFRLPFKDISALCARIATHPIWTRVFSPTQSVSSSSSSSSSSSTSSSSSSPSSHPQSQPISPIAHFYLRPLSTLLSHYLSLSRVLPSTTPDLWLAQAFTILLRYLPGDEESAVRTFEGVASVLTREVIQGGGGSGSGGMVVPEVVWERGGVASVVPFYTYALRPTLHSHSHLHSHEIGREGEEEEEGKRREFVAPITPTPLSLTYSTTLRLPPLSSLLSPPPNANAKTPTVSLPLYPDWVFKPLDYLLRSGQTDIFKRMPPDWDYSEVEVVRATLLVAKVQREVLRLHGLDSILDGDGKKKKGVGMCREEVVFGCMKVFMLEHEQQSDTGSSEEVFRDHVVEAFMQDLLAPFTIASSSPPSSSSSSSSPKHDPSPTLDLISPRFLGSSTPFYQFYTDFVSLYDSISFSHPLFARLLLPPTSYRYPVDFRKYLWGEYGHVVRSVRVQVGEVVAGGLGEYLWPVERDGEMIGAYLKVLLGAGVGGKGRGLEGFVRLVAVHHVAANIWADLRDGSGAEAEENQAKETAMKVKKEEKAKKLLQAVVTQGDFNTIREIVLYRQTPDATLIPPACFEQEGEWRLPRREFVRSCEGVVRERLEKLL
ncbi:hypothetical protein K474DRAFT_1701122 [Panus rudis PR-1116 ss-1]|nr:hypothetical protein K474DRAFT_1701122 [Panus rudis PR-1116 ss-1]